MLGHSSLGPEMQVIMRCPKCCSAMASHDLPDKERRKDLRQKAKSNLQACCRKGTTGLGSNLAHAVLDISAAGLRLRCSERLDPAQEIELELQTPEMSRPFRIVANVIWCTAEDNGTFIVGVEFRRSLNYSELRDFT